MGKIVVAGASGFVGGPLVEAFRSAGHETVALVRREPEAGEVRWDGRTDGPWSDALEGATAVVNLAGAPITLPWTPENRAAILDSRVETTRAIGRAIAAAKRPPKAWINASAVGYYGDRKEEPLDELSPPGAGFLAEVCVAWEAALFDGPCRARRVALRTGVALGRGGGALGPLETLTRAFLGGAQGSGRQWVPWIALGDLVRMYVQAATNPLWEGPFVAAAPEPARNADLMAELRRALGRPWSPPAPALALKAVGKLGGPDPSILLDSVRARPKAAAKAGFAWEEPTLGPYLARLYGR